VCQSMIAARLAVSKTSLGERRPSAQRGAMLASTSLVVLQVDFHQPSQLCGHKTRRCGHTHRGQLRGNNKVTRMLRVCQQKGRDGNRPAVAEQITARCTKLG